MNEAAKSVGLGEGVYDLAGLNVVDRGVEQFAASIPIIGDDGVEERDRFVLAVGDEHERSVAEVAGVFDCRKAPRKALIATAVDAFDDDRISAVLRSELSEFDDVLSDLHDGRPCLDFPFARRARFDC